MMLESVREVPLVRVARYQAPEVTVRPVVEVIPSEPVAGAIEPYPYQSVVLNTRTGELRFHESTRHRMPWNRAWLTAADVPQELWESWNPGEPFEMGRSSSMWARRVPTEVRWTLDAGVDDVAYLGVEAANALLGEIAPHAQALLAGLYDVEDDLDWSTVAARAGRAIGRLCASDSWRAANPQDDSDLCDFDTVVYHFPETFRPGVLEYSLRNLAEFCSTFTHNIIAWHPRIARECGRPGSREGAVDFAVLGVRAWYRSVLFEGDPRPVYDFDDWARAQERLPSPKLTAGTTDEELADWVAEERRYAAAKGVRVLGVKEVAQVHRHKLLTAGWERLGVVVSQARTLLAERDVLMLAMRHGGRKSLQEIGDQVGMSRQGAAKHIAALEALAAEES